MLLASTETSPRPLKYCGFMILPDFLRATLCLAKSNSKPGGGSLGNDVTRLPRAAARVSLNRSKLQRAPLLSTLHRSQNILTSSGFCSILLLSGDYRAPSQYFYTGSVQHRPQPARPWQGAVRTSPSPCSLSLNSACQSWMSSPPLSEVSLPPADISLPLVPFPSCTNWGCPQC